MRYFGNWMMCSDSKYLTMQNRLYKELKNSLNNLEKEDVRDKVRNANILLIIWFHYCPVKVNK